MRSKEILILSLLVMLTPVNLLLWDIYFINLDKFRLIKLKRTRNWPKSMEKPLLNSLTSWMKMKKKGKEESLSILLQPSLRLKIRISVSLMLQDMWISSQIWSQELRRLSVGYSSSMLIPVHMKRGGTGVQQKIMLSSRDLLECNSLS